VVLSPIRPLATSPQDFAIERLRWLVEVRFWAMGALLLGVLLAVAGALPGLGWEVWLGAALIGLGFNGVLVLRLRPEPAAAVRPRWNHALQVGVDFVLLTAVLWSAGRAPAPLVAFYVFHVVLLGTFHGRRAAFLGAGVAAVGASLVVALQHVPAWRIGEWNPATPAVAVAIDVASYIALLGGVAYGVSHAVRELRERERALAIARAQVELDYQLLTNTLDELQAGLEVLDGDGRVLWRNRLAARLGPVADDDQAHRAWSCAERGRGCAVDGRCPVELARLDGVSGRCRFAASLDGDERVFEMLAFPLPGSDRDRGRVMNLYVDRTQATLAERSLVQAERLVSLGRVAQGVAHGLNTPLATLQTLSADLRAAVSTLTSDGSGDEVGADGATHAGAARIDDRTIADLSESAEAIHAETRRLGRVTQALLVGADLVQGDARRSATVGALIERARAVVVAGSPPGTEVLVRGQADAFTLVADPEALVQVVINLLQNAVDAVRGLRRAPPVTVDVAIRGNGDLEIRIEDHGPGIDPGMARRLFEPFATTKPPGEGTGLGLYSSKKLVEELGGTLELAPREDGAGTRATILLPGRVVAPVAPPSTLPHRAET